MVVVFSRLLGIDLPTALECDDSKEGWCVAPGWFDLADLTPPPFGRPPLAAFWGRFFMKDPKTGVTKPSSIGHGIDHLEVYLTNPEENNDVLPPPCNRMGDYYPDPLTALE